MITSCVIGCVSLIRYGVPLVQHTQYLSPLWAVHVAVWCILTYFLPPLESGHADSGSLPLAISGRAAMLQHGSQLILLSMALSSSEVINR